MAELCFLCNCESPTKGDQMWVSGDPRSTPKRAPGCDDECCEAAVEVIPPACRPIPCVGCWIQATVTDLSTSWCCPQCTGARPVQTHQVTEGSSGELDCVHSASTELWLTPDKAQTNLQMAAAQLWAPDHALQKCRVLAVTS